MARSLRLHPSLPSSEELQLSRNSLDHGAGSESLTLSFLSMHASGTECCYWHLHTLVFAPARACQCPRMPSHPMPCRLHARKRTITGPSVFSSRACSQLSAANCHADNDRHLLRLPLHRVSRLVVSPTTVSISAPEMKSPSMSRISTTACMILRPPQP